MEYIKGRDIEKLNSTVVTLGKFDGLHKGHQKLISMMNSEYTKVLFTFEQGNSREYIYSEEEKKSIAERLDIDVMIVYPFDEITRNMEPEDFIMDVLIEKLDAKMIVVGEDFRFGRSRKGDVKMLMTLAEAYDVNVIVCEKQMNNKGQEISSTYIRDYILNAKMDKVEEFLGRAYSVTGTVVKGNQIGRTIGFPTINIIPDRCKIIPMSGVYESEVVLAGDDKIYKGLTNVGRKPTIASNLEKNVETYIYDFDKDVYGIQATVYLKDFVRPEMKFKTIEELRRRIDSDKKSRASNK